MMQHTFAWEQFGLTRRSETSRRNVSLCLIDAAQMSLPYSLELREANEHRVGFCFSSPRFLAVW
jgi:hypothetical protein